MTDTLPTWTNFNIVTETFKTVDNHDLKVDIAVPPNLRPGNHSLIIAYHGGYLLSGARSFYTFIAAWLPAYAAANDAVIVLPDYRLLPSATVAEIRSDLEDLWTWVHRSLPLVMIERFPEHLVDLDRILLEGNLAGGFCVAHLALDHAAEVRGVIMVYPMLDCLSELFQRGPTSQVDLSPLKGADLQDRITVARAQGFVSERSTQDDLLFTVSVVRSGEFGAMFGRNKDDNSVDRIRNGAGTLPGKVWILHGKDDQGAPVQGSIDFFDELKSTGRAGLVLLDVVDKEPSEHGFDGTWTIKDEKLAKRLTWINEAWLK